jgi:hypothetical protein
MEARRTDFEHIRQHVNKVKKYASDLQAFIGVKKMTSVVDGEAKKKKGAFNWNLRLQFNFLYKAGTTMLFCNRYNTKFRNIFHKRFQF